MLRIEETEEEVDLRPRKPAEERRYELRGVRAEGESELRWCEAVLNGRGRPDSEEERG